MNCLPYIQNGGYIDFGAPQCGGGGGAGSGDGGCGDNGGCRCAFGQPGYLPIPGLDPGAPCYPQPISLMRIPACAGKSFDQPATPR